MTTHEILDALSEIRETPPRDALRSADACRATLIDPLLRALDRGIADPVGASERDATLFCYALYLLAKWREPHALPYVLRWLSLPGEQAFEIAGDVPTEDGPRILAAVAGGDLEAIVALALNTDANEFCRAVAVDALGLLAVWNEMPRDALVTLFRRLAGGLPRRPGPDWSNFAMTCAAFEVTELFPVLRDAYADGLIDPHVVAQSELDDVENVPGEELRRTLRRQVPIDDVAAATAWWARLSPEASRARPASVGRNAPCPCGSGRKYKKCCLPAHEAQAHARAAAAARPGNDDDLDDEDWLAGELDEEEADEIDEGPLDVRSIVRVCYTRGFGANWAGFRRGEGLEVTEWTAPGIPETILECLECERIEDLDGHWGDPRAGDPIQVDIVDVETPDRMMTVEVYNRAISLFTSDEDDLFRRIHRVCETLRAAARH
jgi:hypothetical protein